MKISVIGLGYVGLSNAVLLAEKNNILAIDISEDKVNKINNRISPIVDDYISEFFRDKELNIRATTNIEDIEKDTRFVIIATPTNYDYSRKYFDTSSIEKIILAIFNMNIDTTIVIKSTVPIGFTDMMKSKFENEKLKIIFCPEFLREGKALYDNLYPSRIIIGDKTLRGKEFCEAVLESTIKKDVPILLTNSTEAEAIKLFSNTYLALRVAYFNELDTFAEIKNLNTKEIIEGVSLDPRIGDYYNNPSFGYGGYCLPKDTKQLLSSYEGIPNSIISATVYSNEIRKKHIVDIILGKKPKLLGIYKLSMKSDSDNFRSSAILDVIEYLKKENINIIIFEPEIDYNEFLECRIIRDINKFKLMADVIICNRIGVELEDVRYKVYTRDIFNEN